MVGRCRQCLATRNAAGLEQRGGALPELGGERSRWVSVPVVFAVVGGGARWWADAVSGWEREDAAELGQRGASARAGGKEVSLGEKTIKWAAGSGLLPGKVGRQGGQARKEWGCGPLGCGFEILSGCFYSLVRQLPFTCPAAHSLPLRQFPFTLGDSLPAWQAPAPANFHEEGPLASRPRPTTLGVDLRAYLRLLRTSPLAAIMHV